MPDSATPYGQVNVTGKTPSGLDVPIPVSGTVWKTETPLGANASVNTGWIDTSKYPYVFVRYKADQPSATAGVVFDVSEDGTTVVETGATTYSSAMVAGGFRRVGFTPTLKYIRYTYTNGSTAQTLFEFLIDLSNDPVDAAKRTLGDTYSDSNIGQLGVSAQIYKDGSGIYGQTTRTGTAQDVNITAEPQPATGSVSTVTSTGTASTALSANTARKGASFYGVSGTVYLRVGATATTSVYTVKLTPNAFYELPKPVNTAIVSVIGTGVINVTEEV